MNSTNVNTNSNANSSEDKKIMLNEIKTKWSKFTDAEVSGLKNKDELVTHIMSKYSQDKASVTTAVDSFLHGRQF